MAANAIDLEEDNSQYVTMGNQAALGLTSGDFTVEAWIKIESIGGNMGICSKGFDANNGWAFYIDNGGLQVFLFKNAGNQFYLQSAATVTTATWYHLAIVFDGTADTLKLYKDGTLVDTATSITSNPGTITDAFFVGNMDAVGGTVFDGIIQCVRISDNKRYTANFTPSTTLLATDGNTIGLWWFNSDLTDQSTNAFNGTFQGTGSATYVTGTLNALGGGVGPGFSSLLGVGFSFLLFLKLTIVNFFSKI